MIKTQNLILYSFAWIRKNQLMVFGLFLLALLVLGLVVLPDFGLHWDEAAQREIGKMNFERIFFNKPLPETESRYYGPFFELILYSLEQILPPASERSVHLIRHAATFLFFLTGILFFFKLASSYFGKGLWTLLATWIFALHPRLFAHAFYNSKDIVFMSMFIICMYVVLKFAESKSSKKAVIAGVLCGLLIDIRIVGVLIPSFLFMVFVIELIRKKLGVEIVKPFLTFLTALALTVFVFWPFLWEAPFSRFAESFTAMSHYNWQGTTLFMGKFLQASALPWYFIPVWIGITTPVILLLGIPAGLYISIRNYSTASLFLLMWAILPLGSVIFLQSILYDGWRHLFFIYPALCLMSVLGFRKLWAIKTVMKNIHLFRIANILLVTSVFLLLLVPVQKIIRLHPNSYVYFNILAGMDGDKIRNNYEADYWGLSYKQGIEFIVASDTSVKINIFSRHWPGIHNVDMLSEQDKNRINIVNRWEDADYFIDNFRWHPHEYPYKKQVQIVYAGSIKILAVYRLSEEDKAFHPDYY